MFINRDYKRTEQDDFKINVSSLLSNYVWATELRCREGKLLGWIVQDAYL